MSEKTNPSELLSKIKAYRASWDAIASAQIKKAKMVDAYINNQGVEESCVSFKIDKGTQIEVSTNNQLRPALNRAVSDARDYQPYFSCVPVKDSTDLKDKKLFQAILDSLILDSRNIYELYGVLGKLYARSWAVICKDIDVMFDESLKQVIKAIRFTNIEDVESIFFDSNCRISEVNAKGRFQGSTKSISTIDENGVSKQVETIEFWEKQYDDVTYVKVKSNGENNASEYKRIKKGSDFSGKKYLIRECVAIRHYVFEDDNLIIDEEWAFYNVMPFSLSVGIVSDDFSASNSSRLTITPWLEHAVPLQKGLNYAMTAQLYNVKNNRGTSKIMYLKESLKGEEDTWSKRNTSETDLPYHPVTINGQEMIVPPTEVQANAQNSAVSEVVQSYPQEIRNSIGTDVQQDIAYNKSGEAIRQTQLIQYKNSKIIFDKFLEFLDDIGSDICKMIPVVYDTPQYVIIDNYGDSYAQWINTTLDNMISDKIGKFDIRIVAGSSKASSKQKSFSAFSALYQLTAATPIAQNIVSNTIDMLASSLDCEEASDIAKRLKLLVPDEVIAVTNGELDEKEVKAKMQQAGAAQAQEQKGQMMTQLQILDKEAQAKILSGQGSLLRGQAAIAKVQNEIPIEELKSDTAIAVQELKNNPEVVIPQFNIGANNE
jgi:hypothetical protein